MGIVRKRDTGEKGNAGEFGTTSRLEAAIEVPPPSSSSTETHRAALRGQGAAGTAIADLCREIDEEQDGGYAGAFTAPAAEGQREFYLRPSGDHRVDVEYLYNRQDNDGALTQATFDLQTGEVTATYIFESESSDYPLDVQLEDTFDHQAGAGGIAAHLRTCAVDDGPARDQLNESFEDPDEPARDAYLRGIGVRRHRFASPKPARAAW